MFYESGSWKKDKLFQKVTVTPDLANDLLRLNTENRPVKPMVVNKYAKELDEGTFHFTGDAIKISKEGVLLDGQHRLLAIVKSGKPMQMHIQSGLDPNVFLVLDTGTQRTISDIMGLKHYKYYNKVASVARIIHTIQNKEPIGGVEGRAKRQHSVLLKMVESLDKDRLEEACATGHDARLRAKFIDSNLIAAMDYIISSHGKGDEFKQFCKLLSTGDGLGSSNHSSIWLLRERLIDDLRSHTKLTTTARYFLLVNTWNAYLKGKSLKKLSKITGEIPDILY